MTDLTPEALDRLDAQHEAASNGVPNWYFDNVAEVVRPGPLEDGSFPYVAIARGNTIAVNEWIVAAHNDFPALVDMARRTLALEAAQQ